MSGFEQVLSQLSLMSGLEWFAALIGILAVFLTARQNIWCWPIGLVMVVLYAWIFFTAKLYANMALQVFFAGAQLYGWWHWRKGEAEEAFMPRDLSLKAQGLWLLLGAVLTVAISLFLSHYTDAAAPWWDGGLTAFSLVAQLWMARKFIQCWPLWLVVDVLYVGLFVQQQMLATALLYGVFVLLAVHGWRSWRLARP